jgi:hypothetical protein
MIVTSRATLPGVLVDAGKHYPAVGVGHRGDGDEGCIAIALVVEGEAFLDREVEECPD